MLNKDIINSALAQYPQWISMQQKYVWIDNVCHITTPFSYDDGDMVEVFIKLYDHDILLSDDGAIMERLFLRGVDGYKKIDDISKTVSYFNVEFLNGEIIKRVDIKDFSLALHSFIQALLFASGYVITSKRYSKSKFINEVSFYLHRNDIRYAKKRLLGRSADHNFDIVIDKATPTIIIPIDTVNSNSLRARAMSIAYECTDLRLNNISFNSLTVYDDRTGNLVPGTDAYSIFTTYTDHLIPWTHKHNLIDLLVS